MSTHIIMSLKEEEVESEIVNGMLTLTLKDESGERAYINICGGDVVNIARKLGNPTVRAKRETVNA